MLDPVDDYYACAAGCQALASWPARYETAADVEVRGSIVTKYGRRMEDARVVAMSVVGAKVANHQTGVVDKVLDTRRPGRPSSTPRGRAPQDGREPLD